MELAIPYELIHPDGTRIVIGNTDVAKADPDYVGWLDPDSGIAGLDSPELREVSQEIVQGHGGLHLDFFHGRRPIVINGAIDPNLGMSAVIAAEEKIKHVTDATSADALLKWTNTGLPKRRLALRRQPGVRITGRRPKTLQLPMVDADYRVQADVENASAVVAASTNLIVANAGNVVASPRLVVVGPVAAPILLRNTTLGFDLRFKAGFALAAGQVLTVELKPPYPSVTRDGVNVRGQVDFLPTTWWGLVKGNNTVRLEPGATGTLQVFWRDAWI